MHDLPNGADRPTDTREALLDAAEALFAEHGIGHTSLRAITARAGANLAAVNYHFRTKDGLVEAVFSRRIEPVNRERLRSLDEAEAGGRRPELEEVLSAFIAPPIRMGQDLPGGGEVFKRLMGRTYSEPGDGMKSLLHSQFREVAERFPAALARALPGLPPAELVWRFHFMLGAMIHPALNGELIREHSAGRCDPADAEALLARLVEFTAAGFKAAAETAGAAAREAGARERAVAPTETPPEETPAREKAETAARDEEETSGERESGSSADTSWAVWE